MGPELLIRKVFLAPVSLEDHPLVGDLFFKMLICSAVIRVTAYSEVIMPKKKEKRIMREVKEMMMMWEREAEAPLPIMETLRLALTKRVKILKYKGRKQRRALTQRCTINM